MYGCVLVYFKYSRVIGSIWCFGNNWRKEKIMEISKYCHEHQEKTKKKQKKKTNTNNSIGVLQKYAVSRKQEELCAKVTISCAFPCRLVHMRNIKL